MKQRDHTYAHTVHHQGKKKRERGYILYKLQNQQAKATKKVLRQTDPIKPITTTTTTTKRKHTYEA